MKLKYGVMGIGIVMASAASAGLARAQVCPVNPNATCGAGNTVGSSKTAATIGGGEGNTNNGNYSTIAGGYNNQLGNGSDLSFVGGGAANYMGSNNTYAMIGGGYDNEIVNETSAATICGGAFNAIIGGSLSTGHLANGGTIGGGYGNLINPGTVSNYQTIGGGYQNQAEGNFTAVLGGEGNIAGYDFSSVLGGYTNTATGYYATVLGGDENNASGTASVAVGSMANANASGCFVFSDASDLTNATACNVGSSQMVANAFVVRATGGVELVTGWSGGVPTSGLFMASGTSYWQSLGTSDQRLKRDIVEVDPRDVLARLVTVPVATWRYDNDDGPSAPHLGPMAQDFHAAFALGADDRHIESIDEGGVAIAAIQGLYAEVRERDRTIEALSTRAASLEQANAEASRKVASLEQRLAAIEAHLGIAR